MRANMLDAVSPEVFARQIDARDVDAIVEDVVADTTRALLTSAIRRFDGRIATVSSFGADSIVLLHILAEIDRNLPIIFVDTGRHFPETLAYVDHVVDLLGLTNLLRASPNAAEVARLDPREQRAAYDPDGCCELRKVQPLADALAPFDAWISGRKRFQSDTRSSLSAIERENGKIKFNPLTEWSSPQLEAYRIAHDLPQHPLTTQGYPSIGCAPCTSKVAPGEDPRAGRWRGFDKTECGIHNAGSGI